jgi:hypothetical protein
MAEVAEGVRMVAMAVEAEAEADVEEEEAAVEDVEAEAANASSVSSSISATFGALCVDQFQLIFLEFLLFSKYSSHVAAA